ncbi:MAG: trigger factor [Melioribacteraceae bacterium]|nr:trigger factor [Melioribacteraceae bacterium]
MDTKVNEITQSEHEIEVTLVYDEIKNEIEDAYEEERKKISLPGFRKGKAPIQMLKKLYGEAIEYQASEKIANKKFWDIVDSEKLQPISTPQLIDLDFKINEKLYFKVKYEVRPELELKDYTNLEIEKPVFKLREEDIEKEIDLMLKTRASFEEADLVSDENFKITIDLQKLDDDDNPVDGNKSENMVIDLSDPKVNPEIKNNAMQKKVGDKFGFTFIDEHMHGEEVHKVSYKYECTVKKIEKIVLPEPTEELIEEISNKKAKSLEEFKDQIRENYKSYYDQQSERIYTNSLLNRIVENNDFAAPKGYVDLILNRLVEVEKENAKRYKTPFNETEARDHLHQRAEWNAKWEIILNNIAKKENIEVEESDLKKIAEEEAAQTGISTEKLMKYYKESRRDESILEEKVLAFLKANNKAKEFDPEEKKEKESKGKKK